MRERFGHDRCVLRGVTRRAEVLSAAVTRHDDTRQSFEQPAHRADDDCCDPLDLERFGDQTHGLVTHRSNWDEQRARRAVGTRLRDELRHRLLDERRPVEAVAHRGDHVRRELRARITQRAPR